MASGSWPMYSQANDETPWAVASAANGWLAYTCPGGVTGSMRATQLTWLPQKLGRWTNGSSQTYTGPACRAMRSSMGVVIPFFRQSIFSMASESCSANRPAYLVSSKTR